MNNLHAKDPKRFTVTGLCRLFGVSKQAYFKHDENSVLRKVAQEKFVVDYIHEIRKIDRGIGGVKLWQMYRRKFGNGNAIGRDRFEDVVDRFDLKVRKRIRKPHTTDSSHGLPTYPNLIRDFIPTKPSQLWVSDITYITIWTSNTDYKFCYLSLILDAYTEEIVGWSLGPTLETAYPLQALRMALKRIEGDESVNLIHHSDRGCQYASNEYVSILKDRGVRISMTESGNPKENPQAERINSTIKNEMFKGLRFTHVNQVKEELVRAIDFYNNERPHMSINMMTPSEAATCSGEINKRWKSYRLIAIKSKLQDEVITGKSLPLPKSQPLTAIRLVE